MVSHIGSNDPNMKWLTLSLEEFERRYPDDKTEYISTNNYSVQEHVRLIEQAISTRPHGIAVPIVSSDAFEGPLRKAIAQGIPVVAFNIPDMRPEGERIPYLTYVGGDEYLTGKKLGEFAVAQAKAGKIPVPKQVVCASHDAAHQGLKARCRGMKDAMTAVGARFEELLSSMPPTSIIGRRRNRKHWSTEGSDQWSKSHEQTENSSAAQGCPKGFPLVVRAFP